MKFVTHLGKTCRSLAASCCGCDGSVTMGPRGQTYTSPSSCGVGRFGCRVHTPPGMGKKWEIWQYREKLLFLAPLQIWVGSQVLWVMIPASLYQLQVRNHSTESEEVHLCPPASLHLGTGNTFLVIGPGLCSWISSCSQGEVKSSWRGNLEGWETLGQHPLQEQYQTPGRAVQYPLATILDAFVVLLIYKLLVHEYGSVLVYFILLQLQVFGTNQILWTW